MSCATTTYPRIKLVVPPLLVRVALPDAFNGDELFLPFVFALSD